MLHPRLNEETYAKSNTPIHQAIGLFSGYAGSELRVENGIRSPANSPLKTP